MSLSSGFKEYTRPCEYWITFKKGKFVRYDKALKADVEVDLTKDFYLLDYGLFKIAGFNKPYNTGVYSNEVRTIHDPLTVFLFLPSKEKVILVEGTYNDKKDAIKAKKIGGKYTQSVYISIDPKLIGVESEEPLVIANIEINGGVFEGWIDFRKNYRANLYANNGVRVTKFEPVTSGDVDYIKVHFAIGDKKPRELDGLTIEQDTELQEFLNTYLGASNEEKELHEGVTRQATSGEESQETDYEEPAATSRDNPPKDQLPADNLTDYEYDDQVPLKDGRVLADLPLDELQELHDAVKDKLAPTDTKMVNLVNYLGYRKAQAAKPKGGNPFLPKGNDLTEEDDDIPF